MEEHGDVTFGGTAYQTGGVANIEVVGAFGAGNELCLSPSAVPAHYLPAEKAM